LKRYRDFNSYLREMFGERVQKISVDAGLNCPNRDGTISKKACIFCDQRGSGTGALIENGLSIHEQIVRARQFIQKRYKANKFIAYFQSFTNTYAPVPRLRELYDEALNHQGMVGLFVATRPDCVDEDVLTLLGSYGYDYLVSVEYGLQSAHDETLKRINRGHTVADFKRSVLMTDSYPIAVYAHVILGLPGEDREMMLNTARFVSNLPLTGIKIHSMYVTKGTRLADMYEKGDFSCLEQKAYADLVVDFLELLPPEMVVQRLTGDPVKHELVAPLWAAEKTANLKLIRDTFERRSTCQGRLYGKSTAGK